MFFPESSAIEPLDFVPTRVFFAEYITQESLPEEVIVSGCQSFDEVILPFLKLAIFERAFCMENAVHDCQLGNQDKPRETKSQKRGTSDVWNGKLSRRKDYTKKQLGKIRDRNKEHKRNAKNARLPIYDAHLRSTSLDSIKNILAIQGKDISEDVLDFLESVFGVFMIASDNCTLRQFSGAIMLFLKRYVKTSLSTLLMTYYHEICGMDSHSSNATPAWLTSMKDIMTNWKSVITCEGFERISSLLSMCVAVGLCSSSNLSMNVGSLKMFSVGAHKKHVSTFDFIDCVLSTITYFVEVGHSCFVSGSLAPLLYKDMAKETLDLQFARCHECYELSKCGNLQKFKDMDENDLDKLLTDTEDSIQLLLRSCKNVVDRSILEKKLMQLRGWKTDFQQSRVQGALRVMPYAIEVFGATGQGKSSVSKIMMATMLKCNGFDASDDRIITLNESDKYMSNYRSYVNGVIIDDVGNTKADYVEKACTSKIIEIVNNQPLYANMAEVDMKGKVSVEPKVVLLTTNVKDLCAYTFSNEPASIVRRAQVVATVRVRPELTRNGLLAEDLVREKYPDGQPPVPDLWLFHLERAYPIEHKVKGKKSSIGWETLKLDGVDMVDVDIHTVLRYCRQDSAAFFANQRSLVENSKELGSKIDLDKVFDCQLNCRQQMHRVLGNITYNTLYSILEHQRRSLALDLFAILPSAFFENDWVRRKFAQNITAERVERVHAMLNVTPFYMFLFAMFCCICPFACCLILPAVYFYFSFSYYMYLHVMREFMVRRDAMTHTLARWRDNSSSTVLKGCGLVAGLYALHKIWRACSPLMHSQGNLQPSSMEEIDKRDAEVNPWAEVVVAPMPVSRKSMTTTPEELCNLVRNNLCHISFEVDGTHYDCNAFFPKSNAAIVPNHMWLKDTLKVKFMRHSEKTVGGNFTCVISKEHSYHIPETDLSVVWVPNGGDWKDLTCYFPKERFGDCPFKMIYRDETGSVKEWQSRMYPKQVRSVAAKFFGAQYDLPVATFFGLCMAPLVTETKGTCIGGFHLGGYTNTQRGISGYCSVQQLEDALTALAGKPGVVLGKSAGTLPKKQYGIEYYEGSQIHPKSPLHFLPLGANCKAYGSVKGRAKYHSEVVETPISKVVEKYCGVANKWCGPKFNTGWPWQASLQFSSKPSCGVEGKALSFAVQDYSTQISKLLDRVPRLINELKPLKDMQTLCGIDGKRFIDKMPVNTSLGYPLSGPKKNRITSLDPDEYPEFGCPVELDVEIWDVARDMERTYRKGERAYPIFKACLKDEPTPKSKDKVRVFQGAPIALQLLVRKYFLPCARILSVSPLESECAVGINAHGPEWDELSRHVSKFGRERILAGDYSKYDLRMPAQVMFAAFRILIDMAKRGDYTDTDISVMEGIATDICYPVMAYNGDLIQHYGSNPSGQNLTVYINSVVNSLLFRCAYYSIVAPEKRKPFNEVCALVTYGDDAKSSVREGYDEFNHIAVADYLAKNDMKFTMPDKTAEPTEYMVDEEADFLKRKNVYNPELGKWVGALDEDSIFKSLHSVLRSKSISTTEQSMQNIDGALREWFFHGREVFDRRLGQMRNVAREAGIEHGCRTLNMGYDDRVRQWKDKHA
jgi:hypothetical protein